MLYTSLDLLIAELISVLTSVVMYRMLANKDRRGWLMYFISSIAMIYVLCFKDSWMSVVNQSMMMVLSLKNYYLFDKQESKGHFYLDRLSLVVFVLSLPLLNGWNGKAASEFLLWGMIIVRTLLLGKNNIKGWIFQILQQVLSVIFGLYRDMYIYIFKSILFAIQGVYGYWKWKRLEEKVLKI